MQSQNITYTVDSSPHQLFDIKLSSSTNGLGVLFGKASTTYILEPHHSTRWFRDDNNARNGSREQKQRKAKTKMVEIHRI